MYDSSTFCALLDRLVERPAIRPACRAIGIDPSSFWSWLHESAAGNERFKFEWGGQIDFLHVHYQTARKRNVILYEATLRDTVTNGQRRQVVHDGKLALAYNDRIAPCDRDADSEMLRILYDVSDPWARDELGRLQPLEIVEPCPAHLSIRAAAALMPSLWGEKRQLDVNIAGQGGVMVLGASKPPEPVAAIEDHHSEPVDTVMAIEAQSAPLDAEDAMTDHISDSPLVADLRRRLREGVRNPLPRAAVPIGRPQDDHDGEGRRPVYEDDVRPRPAPRPRGDGEEGLGSGDVAPGGYRTA
jgi:hypothetical protein